MLAASTEFVSVGLTATPANTIQSVQLAFVRDKLAVPVWLDAEWLNGVARVLVGPDGGIALASGMWRVLARVTTSSTERPVLDAGTILIS